MYAMLYIINEFSWNDTWRFYSLFSHLLHDFDDR